MSILDINRAETASSNANAIDVSIRSQMIILYTLSMPNVGSWNGKWTGSDKFYGIIRRYGTGKANHETGNELLKDGSHYYNFGDGWGASVSMQQITSSEATKLRKRLDGFCGYDWMVNSIENHGEIICD